MRGANFHSPSTPSLRGAKLKKQAEGLHVFNFSDFYYLAIYTKVFD
jgi:hypothetical protein